MALRTLAFGVTAVAAASTASAAHFPKGTPPPPGPPQTLYCMKVAVVTGTLIEKVECWTRQKWADEEVDLDKEWAENGVKMIR